MPIICPSILADSLPAYKDQIEKVAAFAHRLQIDLTDGEFAKSATIKPDQVWWPVGIAADIHLMYDKPLEALKSLLEHQPHLIIFHAEAYGDFAAMSELCRQHKIKIGAALLPQTPVEAILPSLDKIDHVLIFSGDLGKFGGQADLGLLDKVNSLRSHRPDIEIGWDGGINNLNISQLASGGVDVFDVGGYIQNAPNPHQAYVTLERIADETGTT